jgi:hypothetical protein
LIKNRKQKMREYLITKASGEKVPFSSQKLRNSLQRCGANEETINVIIKDVQSKLYEGIPSKAIYQIAFKLLKKRTRPFAAKYKLKQAIMELGPSGYPFEKYIGEILKHQGFHVEVGKIVKGLCVNHEIDVMAEKDDKHFMIECKYHNLQGIFCDVKVPLYIQARFKDVEGQYIKSHPQESAEYQGWVVTNTRFSEDAVKYGTCAGLRLMGWDYPLKGSLKEQIDSLGLYPITCLTTLTKSEKQRLLELKIVLCNELDQNEKLLKQADINPSRIALVLQEVHQLKENLKDDEK